jgi:hypothetical protein
MTTISTRLDQVEAKLEAVRQKQTGVSASPLIFAATGPKVLYGCLVTEGDSSVDYVVTLEGQNAGDTENLNPDGVLTAFRAYEFPNIASLKDGAFTSQDISTTVTGPPPNGLGRFDIAYIFQGAEGSGFLIQSGTPSVGAKTEYDTNGVSTEPFGEAFDPSLPIGALPVARIYMEDVFTGVSNAQISDVRSFFGVFDSLSSALSGSTAAADAAAISETNAANSAALAANLYDQFDDRYLGVYAVEPVTDNDGAPLAAGLLFYDSAVGSMKVYTGSAWRDDTSLAEAAAIAAASSAAAALASEGLTDADAVATAADRVQTGLDAVSTAADVVSVNADAAQTALDALATAADLLLTDADTVATAADRVQTGLDVSATASNLALTNADVVSTSADAAQTALDAAATAADVLSTSANATSANADSVATAADRVQTSLDAAATAADVLTTNADAVATAADAFSTNADAVATAADRVQTGTDVATTTNDRNLVSADKAAVAADLALTNQDTIDTAADRVQTGLDATATAADRVQTGLDAASTAADVLVTNADALATAADLAATNADVVTTNADAAQTGLDVIATAADRVQTGLDAAATAADVLVTNADAIATAADAVSTAADVVSSAASAAAAETAYDNFDDRYLGALASDPTVDNDGNTLIVGALYWNTTINSMKVWQSNLTWTVAYNTGGGSLTAVNNLSDLENAATARTNLGLAIGTNVQAYSAVLQGTEQSFTTILKGNYDTAFGWGNHASAGYFTTANDGSGSGLDADLLDGQEGSYYRATANFTGTLLNTTLPTRLRETSASITDWNDAKTNGWYMGLAAANSPGASANWFMGEVVAHNPGWVTQTVHQFSADTEINTQSWRRQFNDSLWQAWERVRITEAEQTALYATKAELNGKQPLDAVLTATTASFTTTLKSNYDTAFGWGNHASAGYAALAGATFTGTVIAPLTMTRELRTNNGAEIVISAGESHSYATGQTGEYLYVNAESGLQLNISPDNWVSGWAGRQTITLGVNSSLPGTLSVSGAVTGSNLNVANWDTAFGWGDHSLLGYLDNSNLTTLNTSISAKQDSLVSATTLEMEEGTVTDGRLMSPKDVSDAIAANTTGIGIATLMKYGAV